MLSNSNCIKKLLVPIGKLGIKINRWQTGNGVLEMINKTQSNSEDKNYLRICQMNIIIQKLIT